MLYWFCLEVEINNFDLLGELVDLLVMGIKSCNKIYEL